MKIALLGAIGLVIITVILGGVFIQSETAPFPWSQIPSINALFGFLVAFFLIFSKKFLAFLSHREEDLYD